MILADSVQSTARKGLRPASITFLLLWGVIALIGAAQVRGAIAAKEWPLSEEAVVQHATELYKLVASRPAADFDGDGDLSYVEKDAYLIGLAQEASDAFMAKFPYADRNSSGALDALEAFGAIRGITLIAYADRRPSASTGGDRLDLKFYHSALDAQQWLLDNVRTEPTKQSIDNITSVLLRTQGRNESDHHRKLDHGGSGSRFVFKRGMPPHARFQELEGNIAALSAKIETATNETEASQLRLSLRQLEDLLETLENS
jgi:hypothetical protein